MNKFLLKIVSLGCIIGITYLLLGYLADGKTDPFYLRFTSKKQHSLIIGTSRAAQGIVPKVLNKILNKEKFEGPIYNYSFTVLHSPFGEIYYKAIKAKIDKSTKKGLFIISIDPWSIGSRTDLNYFRETKMELAKINTYNKYPNYNYLNNAYQGSYFHLLKNKIIHDDKVFLHDDGWLEVSLVLTPELIKKGKKQKINNYKTRELPNYKISLERIEYVEKTIQLLKKYGQVILVRLPVDERMLAVEQLLDPVFNQRIKKLGEKYECQVLVYNDENYLFPDGNHLYKESGKLFSIKLANAINSIIE